MIYLNMIEPKEIEKIWCFDRPNFKAMDLAMKMKFRTLKRAPRINPFPTGLWPIRINTSPKTMAVQRARRVIFFCTCLSASIVRIVFVLGLIVKGFYDLAVDSDGATNNTQNNKDGNKYASGAQPFIQIEPNEKAEKNATGHSQTDLHDD